MFTRTQYIAGECTHAEYYAQFVDRFIREHVKDYFGLKRLKAAYKKDQAFNSIPLKEWDAFTQFRNLDFWQDYKTFGDYLTQAGMVCIAKEAARQIVEEAQNDI